MSALLAAVESSGRLPPMVTVAAAKIAPRPRSAAAVVAALAVEGKAISEERTDDDGCKRRGQRCYAVGAAGRRRRQLRVGVVSPRPYPVETC